MKKSGSQQLLAKQRLPRASVRLHGLGECLLLLGSGFLTAGAQIGGLALPLGACLTASLPFGRRSLSAALGAAAGYALLCEPAMAAERIALTALLLAAIVVFQGTTLPATRWFLPAMAAGTALVLGSLQVFGGNGGWRPALQWLAVSAAAGVGTAVLRCGTGAGERGRPLYFAALLSGLSGLTALGLPVDPGLIGGCAMVYGAPELSAVCAAAAALGLTGNLGWSVTAALLLPAVTARVVRSDLARVLLGGALCCGVLWLGGVGSPAAFAAVGVGIPLGLWLRRTGALRASGPAAAEELAARDETLMEDYLVRGYDAQAARERGAALVRAGLVCPAVVGAALNGTGVDTLLNVLAAFCAAPQEEAGDALFRARVYKVRHEKNGGRIVFLKVLAGRLRPKENVACPEKGGTAYYKVNGLRAYSGGKSAPLAEAGPGTLCAAAGLGRVMPGDVVGADARPGMPPALRPLLSAQVLAGPELPPRRLLELLREVEDEEPLLGVEFSEELQRVNVQVMGEVQLEVLQAVLRERYGAEVSFGPCGVLYRETIANAVVGCGHFEPLRHYAEVHLRLSPGAPGSGITFDSECHTDVLAQNWQNLIRTHVLEKSHRGVLTGAPLTDVRVTLLAGRAHLKHTEGGDFRQAVYRAVRQGLMQAESVLLEPWYSFTAEADAALAGRILSDIPRMGGRYEAPVTGRNGRVAVTGTCPVAQMQAYARELTALGKGRAQLSLAFEAYHPCTPAQQQHLAEQTGYDLERDVENTPDSVFCSHGAGYPVKWNEAPAQMHIQLK